MERISNTLNQLTPAPGTLIGLQTQTQLSTNYGEKGQRNKLYLAEMLEVIQKTNNWANLPPLSETDAGQRAKDWQDELEREIPLNRVQDCLSRARVDHKSSFPVNLYEISMAWKAIQIEESEAARKTALTDPDGSRIDSCSRKQYHVETSGPDEGVVLYADMFNTSQDVVFPCDTCRPRAHMATRERHIEKNGGNELEPFELIEVAKKIELPPIMPESAEEVLTRAMYECEKPEFVEKIVSAIRYVRNSKGMEI